MDLPVARRRKFGHDEIDQTRIGSLGVDPGANALGRAADQSKAGDRRWAQVVMHGSGLPRARSGLHPYGAAQQPADGVIGIVLMDGYERQGERHESNHEAQGERDELTHGLASYLGGAASLLAKHAPLNAGVQLLASDLAGRKPLDHRTVFGRDAAVFCLPLRDGAARDAEHLGQGRLATKKPARNINGVFRHGPIVASFSISASFSINRLPILPP